MFHFQRFILRYHEDKSDMWYFSGQIYHFSIEVKDGLSQKGIIIFLNIQFGFNDFHSYNVIL
jgi:hypothetical protein